MKFLAALFLSSAALAAPVPLTAVGVDLDVDDAGRLAGTGSLVLKQAVPDKVGSEGVKLDFRCVLPVQVEVRGKLALLPVPNAPGPQPGAKRYLSLGYFSKSGAKAAPLSQGKLDDLAGTFVGAGPLVEERTHFVNGKHVALALPAKAAGYRAPRLSLKLSKTSDYDALCEDVRKNGFRIAP